MLKKSSLVLLTLVPFIAGYLINTAIFIPVIGMLFFYIVPVFAMAFWFYLGSQYAKTNWNMILSVFIGNSVGILSLALYLWQFLGKSDETRNVILAVLPQMYFATIPSYLVARLAVMFETQPNYVGRTTKIAMQVISLICMIFIFTAGYFWGKRRRIRKTGYM